MGTHGRSSAVPRFRRAGDGRRGSDPSDLARFAQRGVGRWCGSAVGARTPPLQLDHDVTYILQLALECVRYDGITPLIVYVVRVGHATAWPPAAYTRAGASAHHTSGWRLQLHSTDESVLLWHALDG